MNQNAKVYIAGHRGLAGSAIVKALQAEGYSNLITRTHKELDLANQAATEAFFANEKPEAVIMAAAVVGGLFDNKTRPAVFCGENLKIQINVIDAAHKHGVQKFIFLGSSCIYPRIPDRLIVEDDILTAPLEKTNEGYAVAKIAGTMLCRFLRQQYGWEALTVMPPNLIGPGDNFDPEKSHVAQGLMVRMNAAKEAGEQTFTVWGTGTPRREYMHTDDFARAVVHLLSHKTEHDMYNIGTGEDVMILELAAMAARIVGYAGELTTDPSKPDGTPRKTMDVSRIKALGWAPTIGVEDAMRQSWAWHLQSQKA
jgi:GDP-L-fucose synthase